MKVKELMEILSKVDGDLEVTGSMGERLMTTTCADIIMDEFYEDKDCTFLDMNLLNVEVDSKQIKFIFINNNYPMHEFLEHMQNLITEKCCK